MLSIAQTSTMLRGKPHVLCGSISMIKDIIVNLEDRIARDPARDFAISIAETFDAHVAGVAFAYTPAFPGYTIMVIPTDIVVQMIAESERSAWLRWNASMRPPGGALFPRRVACSRRSGRKHQ